MFLFLILLIHSVAENDDIRGIQQRTINTAMEVIDRILVACAYKVKVDSIAISNVTTKNKNKGKGLMSLALGGR